MTDRISENGEQFGSTVNIFHEIKYNSRFGKGRKKNPHLFPEIPHRHRNPLGQKSGKAHRLQEFQEVVKLIPSAVTSEKDLFFLQDFQIAFRLSYGHIQTFR